MEPDRGGYAEAYTPAKLPNRTYGGVDYLVAQLGGTWDALLGEGRRIWTVADSDFHFRVNATGQYSSGYAPASTPAPTSGRTARTWRRWSRA